jgi:hypothetical protein
MGQIRAWLPALFQGRSQRSFLSSIRGLPLFVCLALLPACYPHAYTLLVTLRACPPFLVILTACPYPSDNLIKTKFNTNYLATEDNKRLIYHHANVDIRSILKRDSTIRPNYELTIPKGIPLNEHQRIAKRARLDIIIKAPRDKKIKRDESGITIQTIKRQIPQTTFSPLKRLVLTDQKEALDNSLLKKRRYTRSTSLPPLMLPSDSPSLVASPSSTTTPPRSPLKIPAADSHAAKASR